MSKPTKYRKKPVVIEAMRFQNSLASADRIGEWVIRGGGKIGFHNDDPILQLSIHTLEGTMFASPGDYIIRGVKGELYPCKPDIFAATYEPA